MNLGRPGCSKCHTRSPLSVLDTKPIARDGPHIRGRALLRPGFSFRKNLISKTDLKHKERKYVWRQLLNLASWAYQSQKILIPRVVKRLCHYSAHGMLRGKQGSGICALYVSISVSPDTGYRILASSCISEGMAVS